jgi:hypothetical protein
VTAWFQPLNLSSDLLVSNFCFFTFILYRYIEAVLPLPAKGTTETALTKDAVQKSLSPYMFHAAMENCDCAGYITVGGLYKVNPVYP